MRRKVINRHKWKCYVKETFTLKHRVGSTVKACCLQAETGKLVSEITGLRLFNLMFIDHNGQVKIQRRLELDVQKVSI